MNIIVDASVGVYISTRDDVISNSFVVALEEADEIFTPDLHAVEVTNTAWKYVTFAKESEKYSLHMIKEALEYPDQFVSSYELCEQAFYLAKSFHCSVYDMFYFALATLDKKIIAKAKKMGISCVEF